jgi:hypothetical protein
MKLPGSYAYSKTPRVMENLFSKTLSHYVSLIAKLEMCFFATLLALNDCLLIVQVRWSLPKSLSNSRSLSVELSHVIPIHLK